MPFRSVSSLLLYSITIINKGSSLTIVNEGLSLTIVNETTNFLTFSFFRRRFHNETIVFFLNENDPIGLNIQVRCLKSQNKKDSVHSTVHLDSVHSTVHLDSVHSTVHLNSVHGTVHLDSVHGTVHLDSVHGTVHLDSVHSTVHLDQYTVLHTPRFST